MAFSLILAFFLSLPMEGDTPDSLKERIEKLFEDASLWEVGENVEKVRSARKELANLGESALRYVFEERMKTDKTLEIRAIKDLVKRLRRESIPYLHHAMESRNDTVRRNAVYLVGEIKDTTALPILFKMLRSDTSYKAKAGIISAFGKIEDTTAVDSILPFLRYPMERVRISTADALGKLKSEKAVGELIHALRDSFFTVRKTAVRSLARLSPVPLDTILKTLRETEDSLIKGDLIEALGLIGDTLIKANPEDERVQRIRIALVSYLKDSSWALRAQAVEALRRIMNESLRLRFKLLLDEEEHPLVRNRLRVALEER